MKKILSLVLLSFLISSCNPMMHITAFGMRKLNTSQNKYSKKNPYIKIKK